MTLVSGHDATTLDYATLARLPGTLVLFMALGNLGAIADELIAHGKARVTPAAVVAGGTRPEQRDVIAPLGGIADAAVGLEPPALVVIGDVVLLAARLAPHELLESLAG